jgi:KaiC/GvpD/RAD55 family RecA-like ATPase
MTDDITKMLAKAREANAERKQEPRPFSLIPFGDLEPRPLDWLIQDLIERDSLIVLFGDPGAAKTFWALDMAFCVVSGKPHHDRKVKAGPVIYIAGEGHNGLARRRKAWENRHQVDLKGSPIFVSEGPAMLTDDLNLLAVLNAVGETVDAVGQAPQLVVIDTLARNFGPGDENSTQDMTKFVRACDEIRIEHGCAVVLVHHTGHADKSRQRGSTVMNGAIDVSYRLKKNDQGVITIDHGKQPKDFLPVDPFAFKFRTVELGFENEDGAPATSAVLDRVDVPLSSRDAGQPKLGKNQRAGLSVLKKLMSDGDVLVSEWRDACCHAGMNRHQFNDIRKSLSAGKYIFIDDDKILQVSSQPGVDYF